MDAQAYALLTPKELECLRLVARNQSSKEIGRKLNRSSHTIDNQLKAAMRKSGVSDRYALAALVAEHEGRSQGLADQPLAIESVEPLPLLDAEPPAFPGLRLRETRQPFEGFPAPAEEPEVDRLAPLSVIVRIAVLAAVLLVLLLGSVALLQGAQSLANLTSPLR